MVSADAPFFSCLEGTLCSVKERIKREVPMERGGKAERRASRAGFEGLVWIAWTWSACRGDEKIML